MQGIRLFGRVGIKEKALFTRSFSAMIGAGLPLIKALSILASQSPNKTMGEALQDIIKKVEQGVSLSNAMSSHGDIFDGVYLASIKAAEASGKLDSVLVDLADHEEKEYKLSSSIKSAVAYPVFIVCAMILTASILMVLVIPKLESVFLESGVSLPLSTRVLIGTANILSSYWYLIIIVIIATVIFVRYYLKTDAGSLVFGRILISVPVLKDLFINIYMSRFARTLGMLVGAGVPIIQAVQISSEVINNLVYKNILLKVSADIERGIPISQPLEKSPEFPPIVSQMIAVGEQTGKLDNILISLTSFFEEETSKRVSIVTSLLEPILLVIVGVGVGVIVFSIIVPIYQISGSVS